VKLLLDEMYSARLAEALRAANVDATTAAELGLAGRSDFDVFAPAVADGYVPLTENVADFARIAADHLTAAQHQPRRADRVVIAILTSPRRAWRARCRCARGGHEPLEDRVVYLQPADRE
jgi:hypothetical protein